MLIRFLTRLTTLPLWSHVVLTAGVFGGFQWIKSKLDQSYAASLHPVDYATGQTGFSGETIKGYYAVMQDAGTLDVYRTTQLIDFGFLIALGCFGALLATLVARIARLDSWGRRLGVFAGLSAIMGACCDAIENGWSFVMLANPDGFSNWIALPYSGFAVAKFGFITLAMALVVISLICTAAGRILSRPALG